MLLALYLIEILHQTTTTRLPLQTVSCCILSKFYIKPQQQRSFNAFSLCCILSKFYIKPQPSGKCDYTKNCCILSKFYIKPQRFVYCCVCNTCCILSKFYIKPQPMLNGAVFGAALYLIEILHQTTTAKAG